MQESQIPSKQVVSPRCVIDQPLSTTETTRLSPVVMQQRYGERTIRNAKLNLLKGNYKEALRVGNEYLVQQIRDGWNGPLSYFQTTAKLSVPLVFPLESSLPASSKSSYFFQVRLGTQLTSVDEITTLVLQSWYELAKKDSNIDLGHAFRHLLPLLKIYSIHPMPIQFFAQIWIPFWQSFPLGGSIVGANMAMAWSLQICVLLVEHSSRIDGMPELLQELRDHLVEFLLIQQLPKLSSPILATKMAKAVLVPAEMKWEPLIPEIETYLTSTTNNVESLQAVRTVLVETQDTDTYAGISIDLRNRLLQSDILQNIDPEPTRLSILVSTNNVSSYYTLMNWIRRKWETLLPSPIVSCMDRILKQSRVLLSKSDNSRALQHRKMQLGISILSVLVAWRSRKAFQRWGKLATMALLSPVIELIEALVPVPTGAKVEAR